MQTRIESTGECARRLDISCESGPLRGSLCPSRATEAPYCTRRTRLRRPDGHTVDISSAKWTTPTGTYYYCRFPVKVAENSGIPR